MRFFALLLLTFLLACIPVNMSARPEFSQEYCLIVQTNQFSWGEGHVKQAAQEWNKKVDKEIIRIYPNCKENDILVPFSFLTDLPQWCDSWYGCTRKQIFVNDAPMFVEIVVSNDASYWTIVHELGHLIGCRHGDMGPPCI